MFGIWFAGFAVDFLILGFVFWFGLLAGFSGSHVLFVGLIAGISLYFWCLLGVGCWFLRELVD